MTHGERTTPLTRRQRITTKKGCQDEGRQEGCSLKRCEKVRGPPCPSRMAGFPKLSNAAHFDVMGDLRGMRSHVFMQSYAIAAES